MTDTVKKVAELTTNFFSKGTVKAFTKLGLIGTILTATGCSTMAPVAYAQPYNPQVNPNAGNANGAMPVAQPTVVVAQRAPTFTLGDFFAVANAGLGLAERVGGDILNYDVVDRASRAEAFYRRAEGDAVRIDALGNYNYNTAMGRAAVIEARGRASYDESAGRALENESRGGRGGFNPQKHSRVGRGGGHSRGRGM